MKIGNLKIANPIFLAPMAGVTDEPFRTICREMGAGVVYTEFVSADGIIRSVDRTLQLARFSETERPIGIQIFGHIPEVVGQSARDIYDRYKPDIIDINYGCPVPKIVKRGAGSGALKDLCLMDDITSAVVEAVPEVPVTVKMRAGINHKQLVSTEAAVRLEKFGIKAITLHPRTVNQQYTGKANWDLIKEMKEAVSIPIIGNGDITCGADAARMFEHTGCDAVMVGRASLGNPWIFNEIKSHFDDQSCHAPDTAERIKMCIRHHGLIKQVHNEIHTINMTKKHFAWYLKGFPGASEWRTKFMHAKSLEEMSDLLGLLVREYNVEVSEN